MVQGIERVRGSLGQDVLEREWQEGAFFILQRTNVSLQSHCRPTSQVSSIRTAWEIVNNGHSQAVPQHSDLKGGGGALGTEW